MGCHIMAINLPYKAGLALALYEFGMGTNDGRRISKKCLQLFFVLLARPTKTDQFIKNFQLLCSSPNLDEIWYGG